MDPLVEWKIKKYARLFDIPPEMLKRLEDEVNNVLEYNVSPETLQEPQQSFIEFESPTKTPDTIDKIDSGSPVRITSPFGNRIHPIKGKRKFHNGVDLAMAKGEKVYAIDDGTVYNSSNNRVSGNFVIVSHEDGRSAAYAHLSKRLVNKGQVVKKGQVLGLVGSTGLATGNHLHFIVREKNKRGKWIARNPTETEIRLAIGGRELRWGKHKHSSLEINVIPSELPLTKQAVQISIEPYYSVIQDAVQEIESRQPGYFSNVNRIVVEPGSPGHFGKVQSDQPDTIFISLDKIKSALQGIEGEEQARAAVREVLTHEMGHLKSEFQGGEAPAEAESKRMESFFQ